MINKIYKDLNFWIALAALLISGYTLFDTIAEQKAENKKWEAINLARIAVIEGKFVTFRKISLNELHVKDWGYNPRSFPPGVDDNPNDVLIKNLVVAFDPSKNETIPFTSAIKMNELMDFFKDDTSFHSTHYAYFKQYVPMMIFQNVGQTSCVIDSVLIKDIFLDNLQDTVIRLTQKNFTLEPGQKYFEGKFAIRVGLDQPLPKFHFKYNIYFTNIKGESDSTKVFVQYDEPNFLISKAQ